jgi:hypothetical protein
VGINPDSHGAAILEWRMVNERLHFGIQQRREPTLLLKVEQVTHKKKLISAAADRHLSE